MALLVRLGACACLVSVLMVGSVWLGYGVGGWGLGGLLVVIGNSLSTFFASCHIINFLILYDFVTVSLINCSLVNNV